MYIYFKDVNIENTGTHLAYHADLCKAFFILIVIVVISAYSKRVPHTSGGGGAHGLIDVDSSLCSAGLVSFVNSGTFIVSNTYSFRRQVPATAYTTACVASSLIEIQ